MQEYEPPFPDDDDDHHNHHHHHVALNYAQGQFILPKVISINFYIHFLSSPNSSS
jgi:hypothetical protein